MNRKQKTCLVFLLCLGLAILLISYANAFLSFYPQVIATKTTPVVTELRGVWLTNVGSPVLFVLWGINRALYQLSQLHFNTVYPVVWNRGHTFYRSSVAKQVMGKYQDPLLGSLRLGQDVLAEMVKQGQQEQVRIIPWFEYGFMAPANSELVRRHPNWLTRSRDNTKNLAPQSLEQVLTKPTGSDACGGLRLRAFLLKVRQFISDRVVGKTVWLNPLHPEVQQFILDLIIEVVTKYDVAGIQLDDHFGLPVELGYDPYTVQLYQQEHGGKSPPNNPNDSEWMRWRADQITNLMQHIFQAVKAVKPECLISLSPNSYYFAYSAYLQDWQTWVQSGLVDELVLQIYRDDLKTFLAELSQPAVQMARRQIPVSVGILSGLWSHPVNIKQIQQQVQAIRDRGFNGVSFFYWESLWGYITPESPQERREILGKLFSANSKSLR